MPAVSRSNNNLYHSIKDTLLKARSNAFRAVNFIMVESYWNVGRLIVEEEQKGKHKAQYGAQLIENLSIRLSQDLGDGFSEQSLRNMRQFYKMFPIRSALRSELSWTHYKMLIRLENKNARIFYINECADSNWSSRALERQIHSHYYERLLSSKNKTPVRKEAETNTKKLAVDPRDLIKDPYVLEFLNLKHDSSYEEKDIESGLILCAEKDETVAKYSVLKDGKRLFASKYKLYLPTEAEWIKELQREQEVLKKVKIGLEN